MSNASEFALKRDVRNSAIVREADTARSRMWRWRAAGIVGLAGIAILWAFPATLSQQQQREVDALRKAQRAEEARGRRLRLQVEELRAPARLQTIAEHDLQMVAPKAGSATVIERVVATVPPPHSVVARR